MTRMSPRRIREASLGFHLGLLVALPGALGSVALLWMPEARPFAAVLVPAAGLTVLMAVLGVQALVTAPLRRVRDTVGAITEGDFGSRIDRPGPGAIGALARGLNELVGVLESRMGALRASERRYRLLYEHNPAGLCRTRPDGRVLECNPAAVRILGYDSAVDAKTRNAETFYADPADRAWLMDRLEREHALTDLELRFRRKDGREIPVLVSIVRSEGAGGIFLDAEFVDLSGYRRAGPAEPRSAGTHRAE